MRRILVLFLYDLLENLSLMESAAHEEQIDQRMENQYLQAQIDSMLYQFGEFKDRQTQLKRENQTQAVQIANLSVDSSITMILAGEVRAVRMRFLDEYQRSAFRAGDETSHWNQSSIIQDNAAVHDGHILLDAVLFEDGSRNNDAIFKPIYGISLRDFTEKYKPYTELYCIFNYMGTVVVEAMRVKKMPSVAMRERLLC